MYEHENIFTYRTADDLASVALYVKDVKIWQNHQRLVFASLKQTVSYHVINILKEKEFNELSVVKGFLTTSSTGNNYNVVFYSL